MQNSEFQRAWFKSQGKGARVQIHAFSLHPCAFEFLRYNGLSGRGQRLAKVVRFPSLAHSIDILLSHNINACINE